MAIGHPFGATGARDVLTLALELRERHALWRRRGMHRLGTGRGPSSRDPLPLNGVKRPRARWGMSTTEPTVLRP